MQSKFRSIQQQWRDEQSSNDSDNGDDDAVGVTSMDEGEGGGGARSSTPYSFKGYDNHDIATQDTFPGSRLRERQQV